MPGDEIARLFAGREVDEELGGRERKRGGGVDEPRAAQVPAPPRDARSLPVESSVRGEAKPPDAPAGPASVS